MYGVIVKSETGFNFNIEYGRQLLKSLIFNVGFGHITHNNFPKEFKSGYVLPNGVSNEIDQKIRNTPASDLFLHSWSSNNFMHLTTTMKLFVYKIINIRLGIQGGLHVENKSSSKFHLTEFSYDQNGLVTE